MGLWVCWSVRHFFTKLLPNLLNFFQTTIKCSIMDGFWSSRCLNYCIDVPDKIVSFSSGATTSMVVKNGTKKNFWGFSSSTHDSWKLLYSLCFSSYIKMVNSKWFHEPRAATFAHKVGKVSLTLWVKFWFQNDQFSLLALTAKIATFQIQITQ